MKIALTALSYEICSPSQHKSDAVAGIKWEQERAKGKSRSILQMKSSMNLITALDVHCMMMIYDDAPNVRTARIFMNE